MTRFFAAGMFSIVLLVPSGGVVYGQAYPTKVVRIVTGFPGGNSDFIARLIAQGVSRPLGQPVIVENRGSAVAQAEDVSRAPPDGHVLLLSAGSWYIATLFEKRSAYDPVKDFSPITITSTMPRVLVVHPSLPVKSAKELIALAKARPELNYASSGIGGPPHIAGELLKFLAKINVVHVPYKGAGQAGLAVAGGEVQVVLTDYVVLQPHIKSGKLRALAVTSAQPSQVLAGLPTLASTVPGYVAVTNTGTFVRANTPAAIINRLNQEIVRYLNTPEAKERILSTGSEVVASSPDQLASSIKDEMSMTARVIEYAGLKVD